MPSSRAGRRLVQVGFMRRYDSAYRSLRQAVVDGAIGAPLLVHCAHRNASVPPSYSADMMINDSAVHEIDATKWLLDEEIVAVRVRVARDGQRTSRLPRDWRDRFARAYDAELRAWLEATSAGSCTGPTAWDGYAAAVVAETCLGAPRTGEPGEVALRERPSFYDGS